MHLICTIQQNANFSHSARMVSYCSVQYWTSAMYKKYISDNIPAYCIYNLENPHNINLIGNVDRPTTILPIKVRGSGPVNSI